MTAMLTGAVTGAPEHLEDTCLGWETLETCDRCGPGINALWMVFTSAGPLTFCGSHYRQYRKVTEAAN